MPGSGKSFAAMKDHIIPALQKGRKVFARINGLDRAKIAEVAGLTNDEVDARLVELDEEQVRDVYRHVDKDALVVLDELQNFFPRTRQALSPEMTKFIAEHRHHGLDLLCMGQLLKDCHSTWINRTNRKIQFLNKDVLGKPNEYKWKMFNGAPDDKGVVRFSEVTGGSGEYDPKYFGTYRSFREETENTERLADSRVVVWNNPVFKKWLPILGVVVLAGLGYIGYLFNGGLAVAPSKAAAKPVTTVTEITQDGKTKIIREGEQPAKVAQLVSEQPKATSEMDWPDLVSDYSKENRLRLVGVLRTNKTVKVIIEWRDKSMQIVDQMQTETLKNLGYYVMVSDDNRIAILTRPGARYIATAWPLPEPVGKATKETTEQIRDESKAFGKAPEKIASIDQ